ncbi:predicted protein [Plenodomus lingam JN3]|uniref:Predicted protein n=1 Tax=Leptosphaeria maculans (strain JN3 / isolate v23.1.3 / race Av1-4-5-6-7-8) TaxID=985895 RepID=E5A1B3_LEPMJ|nr:predicted protein [Plenodomus lingam JN3]CBX97377.1 predicted protein [Plenodomus lingam JN3]
MFCNSVGTLTTRYYSTTGAGCQLERTTSCALGCLSVAVAASRCLASFANTMSSSCECVIHYCFRQSGFTSMVEFKNHAAIGGTGDRTV